MARTGRPKAELRLTADERETLVRWSRRAKSSQALAQRCKIVLACAEGTPNSQVAALLGVHPATVGKWRGRVVQRRLDGLMDEDRPGRPPSITVDQVEAVVVATLEETPTDAAHWSTQQMADRSGLSKATIGRIWRTFGLKPHLADSFKRSSDPLFVEKVVDIVGLYHHPPERAVVLCVDEQVPDPGPGSLPAGAGDDAWHARTPHPRRPAHGIPSLFAAFNLADGTVMGELHRQHRAIEFTQFLTTIDKTVPPALDVQVICDHDGAHKPPAIKAWLGPHPRFHLHFTPTGSSWINQVERWFGFLTDQLLQRGVHKSVQALEADIR